MKWVALMLAGALALTGCGSGPNYQATVTGSLPRQEAVGQQVQANVNMKNTGPTDMPHAVLDLTGVTDHWVIDSISSDAGSGTKSPMDSYYDFGALAGGESIHVTLDATPKDSGNHDFDLAIFSDMDSAGVPNGNPLDTATASIAIDP